MRFAMLGHLQEIGAHGFWEIVDAGGMGEPQKGKCVQSPTTDVKGQVIDGPKDLETQIKRVLGLPDTETK